MGIEKPEPPVRHHQPKPKQDKDVPVVSKILHAHKPAKPDKREPDRCDALDVCLAQILLLLASLHQMVLAALDPLVFCVSLCCVISLQR